MLIKFLFAKKASRVFKTSENVLTPTAPRQPRISKGLSEITNSISEYDKQYYLNAAIKAGETKPVVKSRTPLGKVTKKEVRSQLEIKLEQINGEAKYLKIFSCHIDSIEFIEKKLHEVSNQQQQQQKKLPMVGEHMYEFIGKFVLFE